MRSRDLILGLLGRDLDLGIPLGEDVTTTNAESDSGNATSETEELADDEGETNEVVGERIVEDKVEVTST
jgi:hypothetical protein